MHLAAWPARARREAPRSKLLRDMPDRMPEASGSSNKAAALKGEMMHEFLQATLACEPVRMPRIDGA